MIIPGCSGNYLYSICMLNISITAAFPGCISNGSRIIIEFKKVNMWKCITEYVRISYIEGNWLVRFISL